MKKYRSPSTTLSRPANRMIKRGLCVASLLLMIAPALAVRAPDPQDLPPPMPETMPPLPAGQKPAPEEHAPAKPPPHGVDEKSVELVARLFKDNNLSLDNLQITRVIAEDLMTMPVPKPGTSVIVHVQQLYRNLPVHGSGGELVYDFLDGRLNAAGMGRENEQKRKTVADLNIELMPVITRWQAIEGMHQYAERDPMSKRLPPTTRTVNQWDAHLVILDSELGGNAPRRPILAWRVARRGGAIHAFIDATSGKMLSYDNGIRH